MCSSPVTFGGGIATEKFSTGVPRASGWKWPAVEPFGQHSRLDLVRVVTRSLSQHRQPVSRHESGDLSVVI